MQLSLFSRVTLAYMAIGVVLRAVLIRNFGPAGFGLVRWFGLTAAGALLDLSVAMVILAIPRVVLAISPRAPRERWSIRFLTVAGAAFSMQYLAAVEFFFFDEFNTRFNHIALDYVLYPTEVFGNIYQSFNIGQYALEAFVGAIVIAYLIVGGQSVSDVAVQRRTRRHEIAIALVRGALAFALLWFSPAVMVDDRVANEIGLNGPMQLARALKTASLDYDTFYATRPEREARLRSAAVLEFPVPAQPEAPDFRLVRSIAPLRPKPLRSIVVVLEESLGSDFIGCLGAQPGDLTPGFDRWAKEGLLLTNLFATGNRTVRGLEATLCSMVPLPGDSIVKREHTDQVDGLPAILGRLGFSSAFFYGGRGVFDNIRNFTTALGYQQLVEQSDYPAEAFTTAWGVADQYIFDAALARQIQAKKANEKLFVTVLSVSNHKPFLVPPGPWGKPKERNRHVAVRYSDWAVARYLDQMRDAGLLEDTAVVVAGDHGARVYGSERIPIRSYRIPALFLVPDAAWKGVRLGRLASQIDLPATLLALAGIGCDVPFFGSPVTGKPEAGGRAFVQHNHEIGMLDDENMAVLGLRKVASTYKRLPGDSFGLLDVHTPLEIDAASIFQVAEHQYNSGKLNTGAARVKQSQ